MSADYDDQEDRVYANVHGTQATGWFWRLLGLFKGHSHPSLDDGAEDSAALQAWMDNKFKLSSDRSQRYDIFDEMDMSGLVSSILDLYAEETTQPDYDKGQSVWVESKNGNLVKSGHECLRNIQIEDRVTPVTRRTCKYGDEFLRLIYQTGQGVLGWRTVRAKKVSRLEDKYSRLIGFRESNQTYRKEVTGGEKGRDVSWPWDYVHFRLLGRDDEDKYGSSLCLNMFRSWRALTLAEDSVLMYRLRRTPDRNVVMINGGDLPEHERAQLENRWRKRFRKSELVDPASPNYTKQYNPLAPLEDIFLTVRDGDSTTRIENLQGSGNVGELYDLDHFRRTFFGSAKVPQAFLGFEGDISSKSTLMQQDVRFARTCKRVRKAVVYGIRQVLDIHFSLLPTNPEDKMYDISDPQAYVVQMSPISYLDEWERLELVQLRYQIVESMSRLAMDMQLDPKVWAAHVLLNFAKLPEDLVLKLISKTSSEPQAGFESDLSTPPANISIDLWEQLDESTKRAILRPSVVTGLYDLTEAESVQLARAVHESPQLRKVIGDFAYYFQEDIDTREIYQIDPSLLPPTVAGVAICDSATDDNAAALLTEDLAKLRGDS